jgi:hypothetical protein
VRQLSTELTQPRAASEEQLLLPDGSRGGSESATLLTAAGESVLLVVPLINQPQFGDYRLEIIDDTGLLWASDSLRPRSNDSFAILVPRAFLKSGKYQVVLYGVRGAAVPRERLETYSLRVP